MSKRDNQLRCIHRHTIKEHPKCFQKGLLKIGKEIEEVLKEIPMTKENEEESSQWFEKPGIKIGYLDVESDGLNADFGTMLSWAVKKKGGEVKTDNVTKEELFNGTIDKRLVQSCLNEISKFDVICTYNGTYFDIPFLRAKALHFGLEFPGFIIETKVSRSGDEIIKTVPELYHWDLYFTAKSKLCLTRKSLENVCDYLGIRGKTPIEKDVWRKAKYGDPKAMRKVVYHNSQDVIILEKLHDRLSPFKKWIKNPV